MKRHILATATLGLCLIACAREHRELFDNGWLFRIGADSAFNSKSEWRAVDVPHDWSIEGAFSPDAPAGNDGGYLPTGTAWYLKDLEIGPAEAGRKLQLYFEGVYMASDVYVNGQRAGGHPYGYSSFFCDITPYLKPGRNTIAVKADNSRQKNCRWYSGSGIYRHVWLINTEPTHIANHGIYVVSRNLGNDNWSLDIESDICTATDDKRRLEVRHTLADASGNTVATANGAKTAVTVKSPGLWSPASPTLYTLTTELLADGKPIDRRSTTTGFRSISYDSANGLMLNGRPIVLNGGCLHHDNGILGAAAYDRAEIRKAALMKDAGFNAVRTSHNLPSEAFLNACDSIGLLVIDEAFDGWRDGKNPYDYSTLIDTCWQDDIAAMVLRDRNHPSIFCWSIGNEIIERKKIEVIKTASQLAGLCRLLDPSRPVTSALASWDNDWDIYDPLAAQHEIVGYNYMIHKAESDHDRVPSRVMMQTESYPRDVYKNYRTATDLPYVTGDFVWTAIDYLGESGIGRYYYEGDVPGEHYERPLYPWHAAYCGDIDLTGWRKPVSHYRSMLHNPGQEEKLYMAVREPDGYHGRIKETLWSVWPTWESWNWPGHEGKDIEVEIYTTYPAVKLYLDDTLVGTNDVAECRTVFTLPYRPGTIRAEAVDSNGKSVDTRSLTTSGAPASIRLSADRTALNADGGDIAFVTVEVVDAQGRLVPDASIPFTATAGQRATVAGIGNGDIKDNDPYFDASHTTWKGRALIAVRSTHKKGKERLKVTAKGLPEASITFRTK